MSVSDHQIDLLADQLLGLTGADIASLIREARTNARKAGRTLRLEDLRAAADRVQPPVSDALMRRVALHEAAHLVCGHALGLPAATQARMICWTRSRSRRQPEPPLRLTTFFTGQPKLMSTKSGW